MADSNKVNRLEDSMGVSSSPEQCSPDGSPQKMISDCSDLYDLINFHSSATTQIREASRRSSTSSSSSAPRSPEIKPKHSRSSSASSGHFDGPDSDSGSFSRTNGHVESREPSHDRELLQSISPESALESSPEDKATTVPSSVEAMSPAGSVEDSRGLGDVSMESQEVNEEQEAVVPGVAAVPAATAELLKRQDSSSSSSDLEEEGTGVVAIESPPSVSGCPPPPRTPSPLHASNILLVDVHEPGTASEVEVLTRDVEQTQVDGSGHEDSTADGVTEVFTSSTTCTIVNVEEKVVVRERLGSEGHSEVPQSGQISQSEQGTHILQLDHHQLDHQETETHQLDHQETGTQERDVLLQAAVDSADISVEVIPAEPEHHTVDEGHHDDYPIDDHDHQQIVVQSNDDSAIQSDEDPEEQQEESTVTIQTVKIVEVVERMVVTSGSDMTTETQDTPQTELTTTTTTATVVESSAVDSVQPEESTDLHADQSSGSDSDSEYSSGKKFKQMKTRIISESMYPSAGGTATSTKRTTTTTETKMEVSTTSRADMTNGESTQTKSVLNFVNVIERSLEGDREVVTTGVSIKDLKASFDEQRPKVEDAKPREVIDTGVNIKSLKSSFSSMDSVQQQQQHHHQEINDIDGVKIDRNKITRNFSQTSVADESATMCRICGKQVFHMERIKAEKGVFHKGCFRCKECSKPLSVDTYCSHEGVLYCRPHFRQLFQPKAKFEEEPVVVPIRRKHEMIIKENVPAELPPDVIRSADKPDYGLNEIPSLKNIKSRFESSDTENGHDTSVTTVQVKRSESIASKMAKFQGTHSPDDGIQNDSSSSDEEDDVNQDSEVAKECKKSKKEKSPQIEVESGNEEEVVFSGMSELKSQWEAVSTSTKEERARERQEELAKLRLRLCHGKGNIKAMYESACEESSGKSPTRLEQVPVNGDIRTSSIKEKFERGDVINDVEYEKVEKMQREKQEDLSVFEQGSAIDARNLFKKMDSSVKTATPTLATTPTNNVKRSPSMRSREVLGAQSTTVVDGEIVKATDKVEDDLPVSLDVSSKFKFFENYQDLQGTPERKRFTMTPPREPVKEPSPETEIARDPNIVRCCDREEEVIVTDTARKMLNKFRELEYQADHEEAPVGPKPLKRITPPREYTKDTESPEPELPRDPNIVRACDKIEDDFLIEAHKARNLKQKFEHWDVESDVERENRRNVDEELLQQSPETAKNLKAKFEALNEEQGVQTLERDRPKSKINRFI